MADDEWEDDEPADLFRDTRRKICWGIMAINLGLGTIVPLKNPTARLIVVGVIALASVVLAIFGLMSQTRKQSIFWTSLAGGVCLASWALAYLWYP